MTEPHIPQPRAANGQFTSYLTTDQFEEYRKGTEQRFKAAEKAVEAALAASEKAVSAALAAVDKEATTHAKAHEREHKDNEKAVTLESGRVNDRLKNVEEDIDIRLRKVEDAILVSATEEDLKAVKVDTQQSVAGVENSVVNAKTQSARATVAAVLAGAIALFNALRDLI